MSKEEEQMQEVVKALDAEISARKIPPNAFMVKPVIFSGNYTGQHSKKNPPLYGFTVQCTDEHAGTIREMLSVLKRHPKIQPLENYSSNSTIARLENQPVVGFAAGNVADLIGALNSFALSEGHQIECSGPSQKIP
jgi:hypothetical protein